MEVHSHLHTERKKWTHYLWEFLMLFLAVFCGFLAENLREHQVEHQREKQYMRSLVNDLQRDSINIQTTISVKKREVGIADSLYQLLSTPDYKNRLNLVYYYGRMFSGTYNIFYMTDGTLIQLKNAGGFRLINKQNIVDSILSYDNLYSQFKADQDILYLNQLQDYRAVMIRVFDIRVFNSMISEETGEISIPSGNPPLFNTDPELINELLMRVHLARRNIITIIKVELSKMENKARVLIDMIKNEYHLE